MTTTPVLPGPLAIADDADHVCVVGGDGTVRYAVAAVRRARRRPSISIYPLGTVNLLARERGYPREPDAFVRRAMARSAPYRQHIAVVGDTPMLTCASVGPDSDAVATVSPRVKRIVGRAAYALAFCKLLGRWPRRRLRVVADDRDLRCEAVYIAKGRFFAGQWSFAPDASVDDDLLHVVVLTDGSRLTFLRFAWSVLRARSPLNVIRFTCRALSISGGDGTTIQADGDIVAHLPVRIAVAAETLRFS